jgi:hypothetical protein
LESPLDEPLMIANDLIHLKFSGKTARDYLLGYLVECNNTLRKYLSNSKKISKSPDKAASSQLGIRAALDAFHALLARRFPCTCTTQHTEAMLRLATFHNIKHEVDLDMLLAVPKDNDEPSSGRKWQEADISISLKQLSEKRVISYFISS